MNSSSARLTDDERRIVCAAERMAKQWAECGFDSHPYVRLRMRRYEKGRRARERTGQPAIVICGPGESGKDLVSWYFAQCSPHHLGASTSRAYAPLLAAELDQDTDAAYADRRNRRELWYEFANALRSCDASLLAKLALGEGDIINGVRDVHELVTCRAKGVIDLAIWVDRPGVSVDPTLKFGPEACDLTIVNAGSRSELYRKVARLSRYIRGRCT